MYTFLVLLTNKSSELDFFFLIKARLLFTTHRGKGKKKINRKCPIHITLVYLFLAAC